MVGYTDLTAAALAPRGWGYVLGQDKINTLYSFFHLWLTVNVLIPRYSTLLDTLTHTYISKTTHQPTHTHMHTNIQMLLTVMIKIEIFKIFPMTCTSPDVPFQHTVPDQTCTEAQVRVYLLWQYNGTIARGVLQNNCQIKVEWVMAEGMG